MRNGRSERLSNLPNVTELEMVDLELKSSNLMPEPMVLTVVTPGLCASSSHILVNFFMSSIQFLDSVLRNIHWMNKQVVDDSAEI